MPSLAEEEKDEIRSRILQSARVLIRRRGYLKVSLRDVAQASTFSPAGLYRHFSGWDNILDLLADESLELLRSRLGQVHNASPEACLIAQASAYISFALDRPHDYDLIFRAAKPGLKGSSSTRRLVFEPFVDSARRLVPSSVVNHEQRSQSLAFAVWALVHGLVALKRGDAYVGEEAFEVGCRANVQAFVRGFLEKLSG